ncbi:MAG: hypothetical protein JWM68_2296 [Verrucomicrobiales bacterium]|nr:hypothetical protein [Verrucomicrobiales bacterium]
MVLADTMAIKAAHDLGCWNALRNHYQLHTVSMCIHEVTCRDKSGHQLITRTPAELESEIIVVEVTDEMRVDMDFRIRLVADVHRGERDLLAYALTLRDAWWLCGPDNGTVRALQVLKLFDRMVSLEAIASASGHSATMLSRHYTERWLSDHRTQALLEEL